jgi:phosphatidylglycerophosphate synthase
VRTVRVGPLLGLTAQAALLLILSRVVGLSTLGWLVGLGFGVATCGLLARGLSRSGTPRLGPADRVTLVRAVLVGGVAALTADVMVDVPVALVVSISAVAMVLDNVDGRIARRTASTSALGARFDMEVDAFLILVLSAYVARSIGIWVLAIGLARYVYGAAGWVLPWLREPVPARYWAKVVAAIQAVVLTIAAAGVLPIRLVEGALVVSLGLLAESFGHDARWQWRHRRASSLTRTPLRRVVSYAATGGALGMLWFALVAPNQVGALSVGALARIPLEGLVLVAVAVVLPARPRRILALVVGMVLGVLALVKVLDLGYYYELDRPFNPVIDWGNLVPAIGVVRDSIGSFWTDVAVVLVGLFLASVLVLMTWAVVRLTGLTARHRIESVRVVTALGVVWVVCAAFGIQVASGAPIASTSAVALARDQVDQVRAAVRDEHTFGATIAHDPYGHAAGQDLLTGLRGKDVLFVFVESYGKVAVQGSAFSPQVDAVLNDGTASLQADGWSSRSAFLTSPTFGGISWLAHSTFQSGLWIDNQARYDEVVASNRFTLSGAFKRAGWRTVSDIPSDNWAWPVGRSFYHYDKMYDARNVPFNGPRFSYARIPDQYTLSVFQQRELAKPHPPLMAEIDLVSSHTPWTPLPHLLPWDQLGNGSIYEDMMSETSKSVLWQNPSKVKAAYGRSIQYSMSALISFVQTFHDKNLVMVLLGDHQPATIVSGTGASHDVPISIIAHDPKVLDQISTWGWTNGLLPSPAAPVLPMDQFRDRFLTAYSR